MVSARNPKQVCSESYSSSMGLMPKNVFFRLYSKLLYRVVRGKKQGHIANSLREQGSLGQQINLLAELGLNPGPITALSHILPHIVKGTTGKTPDLILQINIMESTVCGTHLVHVTDN